MAIKSAVGRVKRTKAEVEDEFEKIRQESQQEKLEYNPKTAELARQREEEVKAALKEISSEGLVQRITVLGLEVSKALSDLSSKLTAENNFLGSLREAATIEKKEIADLHKIDVCATALDQIIEEYDEKKAALETESAVRRADWEREKEGRMQEQKEFDDNLKKQRQREKEEYEYHRNTERKIEQNDYDETLRAAERKNKEKQEALEKSWAAREAGLKEREDELVRLRAESSGFPERIQLEAKKSAEAAVKAIEGRHQQELLVLRKDSESENRLGEIKIKSLEEAVARQAKEIESLGVRLDEAKKQVQDIAIKAIEGASGANALSHINKIAMEQAKVRQPQGA